MIGNQPDRQGSTRLTEAVARGYRKLLAYKDEYEVARLYCDPGFWRALEETFEGDYRVRFHLAPPFRVRPDPATGRIAKRSYGPRTRWVFRLLASLRGLRGTRWDPFGRSEERRHERALIVLYESDVARLIAGLDAERLPRAVEIASLPETIRGYGHVKRDSVRAAALRHEELFARWEASPLERRSAATPQAVQAA
jgi:indolepyruvate ferredoxin oxidoreductase